MSLAHEDFRFVRFVFFSFGGNRIAHKLSVCLKSKTNCTRKKKKTTNETENKNKLFIVSIVLCAQRNVYMDFVVTDLFVDFLIQT